MDVWYPEFSSHVEMKEKGCSNCSVCLAHVSHFESSYEQGDGRYYVRCFFCHVVTFYDIKLIPRDDKLIEQLRQARELLDDIRTKITDSLSNAVNREHVPLAGLALRHVRKQLNEIHRQIWPSIKTGKK